MPVPTLVTDLSTTVTSNSPAGSDNVFPDLDNYLRALSGFVASIRDNSGNGWVSPYLPLTYSAGTANGVVYLNGSKVVTTGSALVFDGSNLGLGVTPSAWGGGFKALEMSNGSVSINANGPYINQNAIFDTAWKYKANGLAAQYQQIAGQHQWAIAPSGTAGNAISFTQAMTLDASGNLGVGATSPTSKLHVNNGASSTTQISLGPVAAAGDYAYLSWKNNTGAQELKLYTDAGFISFYANASERARITSGGDLLVGQTSGGVKNSNSFGLDVSGGGYLTISHINGSASGTRYEYYGYNGAEIGSVTQNGTTGVLFNTTSDRRLKDNITPAPSASAAIDAIQIVSHDWKSAPDEHVTYGVIAQDLALVAPQAVLQGDDGDEIEKTWGVDYSKLVPMLIKEIQSLRARVAALEAA